MIDDKIWEITKRIFNAGMKYSFDELTGCKYLCEDSQEDYYEYTRELITFVNQRD